MRRAGIIQKDVEVRFLEEWSGVEAYARRRAPRMVAANDTHRGIRPLWSSDLSQDVAVRVLEAIQKGGKLDLTGDNLAKFARHKVKHRIAEESEKRCQIREVSLDAFPHGLAGPDAKDASTGLHFDADGRDVALQAALATAMTTLTEKQRQLINWHVFQDLTFKQCAKRLGVKDSTVSDCYYAALAKLRAVLKPELKKLQHIELWAWHGNGSGKRTSPALGSDDA